jgi:DNA-binding HxlR family transcriptional regulator
MQKSATEPPHCPFGELLETLARPWTMHILWVLSTNGLTRFGALRRQVVGVSSRVLTERLRVLERKRFVFRDYEPTIPPSVTYGITKRMKGIGKVMGDLDALARRWQQEDAHLPTKQAGAKVHAQRADAREGAPAYRTSSLIVTAKTPRRGVLANRPVLGWKRAPENRRDTGWRTL